LEIVWKNCLGGMYVLANRPGRLPSA